MNKKEMIELLNKYDNAYYNNDESLISDEEYDALKNAYIDLYGEYDYVPGEAIKGYSKFTHSHPILSLAKAQIDDEEKLRSEIERLFPICIQPKFDGLTVVYYGEENTYVTRGNGHIGEVVTENVLAGTTGLGSGNATVRGEVLMPLHTFREINSRRDFEGKEVFKNPRNAAAGMLRNKDASKVEGLVMYAYNLVQNENEKNFYQEIAELNGMGFNVVQSYIPETIDEAIEYIKNYDRTLLDYEIDGLVVKHIGDNVYGSTSHSPKNSFAIKFKQEGVWAKLTGITNQVGRTGLVCPVAEFEPIELLGAEVSRATLHNYMIMNGLGIESYGGNTMVKVIKANEIIPRIVESRLDSPNGNEIFIDPPTNCPICNSCLNRVNDQLFCYNPCCKAKVAGAITHMAKRDAFNIDGLSEETAEKIINMHTGVLNSLMRDSHLDYLIETYKHLRDNIHPSIVFELDKTDIEELPGFAKKSADKLYNAIQKSKTVDFDKFIYGCGLPLVGRSVSKLIANHYKTLENFASAKANNFNDLKSIDGIGDEIIKSLCSNYDTMIVPFAEIDLNIVEPKVQEVQEGKNLKIVITGKFEISRDEIKTIIEGLGSKVAGSVSKATNILLAAEGEESTSKYKKAKELGIKIINSIDELKENL